MKLNKYAPLFEVKSKAIKLNVEDKVVATEEDIKYLERVVEAQDTDYEEHIDDFIYVLSKLKLPVPYLKEDEKSFDDADEDADDNSSTKMGRITEYKQMGPSISTGWHNGDKSGFPILFIWAYRNSTATAGVLKAEHLDKIKSYADDEWPGFKKIPIGRTGYVYIYKV
jgi:hypothetical protein